MHAVRHLLKSWAVSAQTCRSSVQKATTCTRALTSYPCHTNTKTQIANGVRAMTQVSMGLTPTPAPFAQRSNSWLGSIEPSFDRLGMRSLSTTSGASSQNTKTSGSAETALPNPFGTPANLVEDAKVTGVKDPQFSLDVAYVEQVRAAELAAMRKPSDEIVTMKYFELLSERFPHTLIVAYENWPAAPPKAAEELYQHAKATVEASAKTFIAQVEHEGKPVTSVEKLHPSFTDVYGIPLPKELVPDSPTLAALKTHKPALVLPDGTSYYVFHPTPIQARSTSSPAEPDSSNDAESKENNAQTISSTPSEPTSTTTKSEVPPLVMFVVHPAGSSKSTPPAGEPEPEEPFIARAFSFGRSERGRTNTGSNPDSESSGSGQGGYNNGEPLKVSVVTSASERIGKFFMNVLFLGATIGILVWFSERRGAGGIINTEGHSEFNAEMITEKLSDVKGCDEAKNEAQELVDYLMDPAKYRRLGGEAPKGILMSGPPGTGKTLLARAIAGEANVPFYYATGSSFEEVFVGVGSRRIRNLFQQARATAPCIIFIDEIDALGRERRNSLTETSRATLNALLAEMDGFEKSAGIVVIAATNLPDTLDAALRRPGRFDRNVHVDLPDLKGRKDILDHYVSRITAAADIDTKRLAKATSGASGAMLKSIVNTAALRAAQLNKSSVTMDDMEFAQDKIIMGAARTSAIIADKTKRLTAYHEGGHALLALKTPGAIPIYKATILPRGSALGYVSQVPDEDMHSQTLKELLARMDVAMGGRAAEEFISGPENVTTGASSDFNQATRIARKFVTEFGMSEAVGKVYIDRPEQMSEELQKKVDLEVKRIIDESYARALNCLKTYENDLHKIAQGLLKYETLTLDEIQRILRDEPLERDAV